MSSGQSGESAMESYGMESYGIESHGDQKHGGQKHERQSQGGQKGKAGGQKGNVNSFKHGAHSKRAFPMSTLGRRNAGIYVALQGLRKRLEREVRRIHGDYPFGLQATADRVVKFQQTVMLCQKLIRDADGEKGEKLPPKSLGEILRTIGWALQQRDIALKRLGIELERKPRANADAADLYFEDDDDLDASDDEPESHQDEQDGPGDDSPSGTSSNASGDGSGDPAGNESGDEQDSDDSDFLDEL